MWDGQTNEQGNSVNGHWETEFRKLGDFGYVDNVCDHWLLLIGW